MRLSTTSALVAILIALPTTQAAQLTYDVYGDTYAFTLEPDPNDPEIDTFDFELVVESGALVAPVGGANSITDKGVGGTGFSLRLLGVAPWVASSDLSFVGTEVQSDRMFQAYTRLGSTIDPSVLFDNGVNNSYFGSGFIAQAQVERSAAGAATLRMFRSGEVVGIASTSFGVPEPAALALAGLCTAGVIGPRPRRRMLESRI